LRLYPFDYGWKIEEYYKRNYPNLQLEFPSHISLHKSISRSKLVIIDHCMTTMLETFSANIPTVLFWSKTVHETILEDSKPFFDELKNAKILFHDIDELIIALNHINKDVDTWWFNKDRQQIVNSFCNQFAKKSNNLSNDLIQMFCN